MNLLRLKLDAFHCALLVAIVLLAVYAFGSFREGYNTNLTPKDLSGQLKNANNWINSHNPNNMKWPTWLTDQVQLEHARFAHMK